MGIHTRAAAAKPSMLRAVAGRAAACLGGPCFGAQPNSQTLTASSPWKTLAANSQPPCPCLYLLHRFYGLKHVAKLLDIQQSKNLIGHFQVLALLRL